MIALTQALIKYGLFNPMGVDTTLGHFEFSLLVLATLCIAAAGNVINDLYDIEVDAINKPGKIIIGNKVSEAMAFNLFIGLSIVGVGIGFYLSNHIGRSGFSALFVITSALLYIYSTSLKRTVLLGNIVVSALVALSLVIVGLYDLLPSISPENQPAQLRTFKVVLGYALFALTINFIREITKDIEDIKGDTETGMKTLPILIGAQRARLVTTGLIVITLVAILYYLVEVLYRHQMAVLYVLVAIAGPMMVFIIRSLSAKTTENFHNLSIILKIIMLTGILSIPLYPFIL
jgi:4-hydroxybenzoate polyprenyltransferase